MAVKLPADPHLAVSKLAGIFGNTTMSYKFYWFWALLEFVEEGQKILYGPQILARMVSLAWFTAGACKVSLGWKDGLGQWIGELIQNHSTEGFYSSLDRHDVERLLLARVDKKQVLKLLRYVPFHFLEPWLTGNKGDLKLISLLSQEPGGDCPYSVSGQGHTLRVCIKDDWFAYFATHSRILKDFTLWALTRYLQARNPNVPGIPEKIMRPQLRGQLSEQRKFWRRVIETTPASRCVYTEAALNPNDFDLDHFLPWSFVAHDLLWNLVPSNPSVNRAKGDRLPDLHLYLPQLALMHQLGVKAALAHNFGRKLLEDFHTIQIEPQALAEMSRADLCGFYDKVFVPLRAIAVNNGFQPWEGAA